MEILPLISFFTGVISILSPCILPVIPLFVAFSLNSKSKGDLLSFVFGFSSIFIVIVFLTGFFTAIVYRYIFYVRIIAAVLLLAIGILMLLGYSLNNSVSARNNGGMVGSFAFGFLTSLAWAPCYSAYLISLITLLVSSANPFDAAFNILIYCAGFGLTLLGLSLLISKINLEKLILKTKNIPRIFGILIILGAIYMLLTLL